MDNKTNTISGELAWGSTVEGPMPKDWQTNESEVEKVAAANAKFAEFELDKYAVLAHEADKNTVYFYSNGDIDGDGEEDDVRNAQLLNKILTNRKFVFVRNPDHTVSVYRSDGEQVYDEIKTLTVLAEDRLDDKKPSKNVYTLDLTWAEPETEADILTFKLDGFTGTIDDSDPMNRTITVKNVPYGTDVTGMIAEFTTTPNAKVYLTNPDGVLLESGVTSINYTNPVLLYVESEDTKNSNSLHCYHRHGPDLQRHRRRRLVLRRRCGRCQRGLCGRYGRRQVRAQGQPDPRPVRYHDRPGYELRG